MSTNVPGFLSYLKAFLHIVLAKLATSSFKGLSSKWLIMPIDYCNLTVDFWREYHNWD